jgi:hypothetical protein
MSKMKEIYMELLQEFNGEIPEDFDMDNFLKEKADSLD